MDTCSKCSQSILFGCEDGTVYTMCGCGESLPEVDEVAELESRLADCYELLDGIVKRHVAGNDIVILAADLLAKHRGN